LFRLALALGKSVAEIEGTMSSREISEWMAFYRLEPWGDDRADLRTGIVASTIANVNRGKDTKSYQPQDFMAFTEKEEKDEAKALKEMFLNLGVPINHG